MKINSFKTFIAVLLSLLCAYTYWSLCSGNEENSDRILLTITGFITLICTFGGALALEYEDSKHAVNGKILSWAFAVVFIIQHIVFALLGVRQSVLIISSGIILLFFVLLIYNINRTKM